VSAHQEVKKLGLSAKLLGQWAGLSQEIAYLVRTATSPQRQRLIERKS